LVSIRRWSICWFVQMAAFDVAVMGDGWAMRDVEMFLNHYLTYQM
jgi:hypothetical protein